MRFSSVYAKNAMRSENVPHKSSTIPVDDLWITPAPDAVWPLFATRFTVWIIYFHQCNSYDIKRMLDFLKLVDSEHISENMFVYLRTMLCKSVVRFW